MGCRGGPSVGVSGRLVGLVAAEQPKNLNAKTRWLRSDLPDPAWTAALLTDAGLQRSGRPAGSVRFELRAGRREGLAGPN
jgi:hypothetical protein